MLQYTFWPVFNVAPFFRVTSRFALRTVLDTAGSRPSMRRQKVAQLVKHTELTKRFPSIRVEHGISLDKPIVASQANDLLASLFLRIFKVEVHNVGDCLGVESSSRHGSRKDAAGEFTIVILILRSKDTS